MPARYGLGFISQTDSPGLKEFYEAQCRAHGHEPGIIQFPVRGSPTAVFVADDVDEAWDVLGPHLLHDASDSGVLPAARRLGSEHYPCRQRGRASGGERPVPHLHVRRGDRLRAQRPTAAAAPAVWWRCTRCGVAIPRTCRGRRRAGPRQ